MKGGVGQGWEREMRLSHEARHLDPQQMCLLVSEDILVIDRPRRTGERKHKFVRNSLWVPI